MNEYLETAPTVPVVPASASWRESAAPASSGSPRRAEPEVGAGPPPSWSKRLLDVSCSVFMLVTFSPMLFLIALLIKLYDRGPVLHWQRRVGLNGQEFSFPKFRSMCVGAEEQRPHLDEQNHHGTTGVTFKMRDDPRITPMGRFIRKTSIDELPQLWCVLTGTMSLVGPRPPLPAEVARYRAHEMLRLNVVPGLTCFWQIRGRADLSFEEQVHLDLMYLEQQSFWTDVKILALTIPAVVSGKGAY